MKQFHVYEDWTLEEQPRCFYVGKGDDDRVAKLQRNRHLTDVVSLIGHERRIVLSTFDENEALDFERRLIVERHTHPKDPDYNGIGCNRTLGGQGNSGRIVSDETKKKISESKKGKTSNKIWSQEERDATSKRMSILHKGKTISAEHKEILHQRMSDPEIKSAMIEKVTISIRNKYENDEVFRQHIANTRVRGEKAGRSAFTEIDVRQMRIEWEQLDHSVRGSQRKFCLRWAEVKNVTKEAVYSIVKRKTWKHVI
jgi:hypothetical protein